MEYSAFELGHQKSGFLDVAKELGVALVAYSPLGRGLVSGRYISLLLSFRNRADSRLVSSFRSRADFEQGDLRLLLPRFSEENFPANVKLADQLSTMAKKYNATASQLALAWILAENPSCACLMPFSNTLFYLWILQTSRSQVVAQSLGCRKTPILFNCWKNCRTMI